MANFTYTITESDNLLKLHPNREQAVGSQYDNLAPRLIFERPEGRENDSLVLYIESSKGEEYREVLGTGNEFPIPNSLTQDSYFKFQVAFARGEDEIEHTNVVLAGLRDSLDGSAPVPEPYPDFWNEVARNAHWGEIVLDGNEEYYIFYNSAGDEVARVLAGGGGGISKKYVDDGDAAAVASAGSYTDAKTAISPDAGNILTRKANGNYVPATDLSGVLASIAALTTDVGALQTGKLDTSLLVAISSLALESQIPNAKSVFDLIQTVAATIPAGGLSIPISLDYESDLPTDITDLPDGSYWFIEDMDITSPGHTGRVWLNTVDDTKQYFKVVDQYFAPDNSSIVLDGGGQTSVNRTWLDAIVASAVGLVQDDLDALDAKVDGVDTRVTTVDTKVASLGTKVTTLESNLSKQTAISPNTGNMLTRKSNGLYVPPTPLDERLSKMLAWEDAKAQLVTGVEFDTGVRAANGKIVYGYIQKTQNVPASSISAPFERSNVLEPIFLFGWNTNGDISAFAGYANPSTNLNIGLYYSKPTNSFKVDSGFNWNGFTLYMIFTYTCTDR